jgi:hypothetical protein
VLHDGPPYPTGGIHYGTVLNKVLKDIVVRTRLLMGYHARFVPGWDCHGLPIEQQVEKQVGNKDKLGVAEFRKRCEAHALKFVDVMRSEFKRLGCVGIWETPYLTLSEDYEATIVRVLAGFARQGLLYRAKRPVHWCMTHRTALAEAEVEYADHTSPSIYVRLPLLPGQRPSSGVRQDAGGAGHLDHHPLDHRRQPGGGGQPAARLRGLPVERAGSASPHRGARAGREVPGRLRAAGRARDLGRRPHPVIEGGALPAPLRGAQDRPRLPPAVRGARDARGRHGLVHTAPGTAPRTTWWGGTRGSRSTRR